MANSAKSGAEIQSALRGFVTKWASYQGGEREEAQTFLNELFACYGSDRFEVGAKFEDFTSSAGFMDLHWPGICIFEMKAPGKEVAAARDQVKRYWEESANRAHDIPAARWVVICSFHKFEIWEPGRYPAEPQIFFDLDELPDRYDALNFLIGPNVEPVFVEHHRELTKQAAEKVASVYQSLVERSAAPIDEIQRFVMQSVWCLFAEDLGMLSGYPLQTTVGQLIQQGGSSAERVGFLFRVLNQKGSHNRKGVLEGTTYVNGELFADPAEVDLSIDELRMLVEASEFDWQRVDPTIFGSLMEGVLGRERRWELGAHYTHEADIMKIVTPTIVRPWQERIDAVATPSEARDLLDELCAFKVLDPACGCGNFLYVAYRELRALEHLLKLRIVELAKSTGLSEPQRPWPFVPLTNMQGIDIERSAVMIARVTLWMGHRQMIDRYGEAEPPLPLVSLPMIQVADALRVDWPETDCIIGNPPFLGDRLIRRAFGDAYVAWLKDTFSVGVVDFSAYWFRRAAEHLKHGQRAGLVSTNTLRENKHRRASLDYLVAKGGLITDAISSQQWPGEANVHVSITNWVQRPRETGEHLLLNGRSVSGITTQLREGETGLQEPLALPKNRGRSFIGNQISGPGFIISQDEATSLLMIEDSDYDRVVRRYFTGDDLVTRPGQDPGRWVIAFGTMSLEEASNYRAALTIVRERVKPTREHAARHFARLWWQFAWPRPLLRRAVAKLDRFAVCNLQGKRLFFVWAEREWCPSNLLGVVAVDDMFSMGILSSRIHSAWAWALGSTLETRLRYTPTSVFMTFPWPDRASAVQREVVAEACRSLLGRRSELCLEQDIGLTRLYNAMDEGAYNDLKALHRELDEAVADCYGWPKAIAQDDREIVARLTELNRQIIEGERDYDPFTYLRSDNQTGDA